MYYYLLYVKNGSRRDGDGVVVVIVIMMEGCIQAEGTAQFKKWGYTWVLGT